MKGLVTKKHFFLIWHEFGIKIAIKILVSRKPIALTTLINMKGN
jgi:hypothetical protein